MREGVIDFVETDKMGRYKFEKFDMEAHDPREFELLVRRVIEEILTLRFWNSTCKQEKCEYCELRRFVTTSYPGADGHATLPKASNPRVRSTIPASRRKG